MGNEDRVGRPLQKFDGVVPPQVPNLRTHDEFGLSLDPKHWAKRNCKNCHGEGVYTITKNEEGSDASNNKPMTESCDCAFRAYWRVRRPLQDRVRAVWAHPGISQQQREEAAKALVEEALKQVKNTGMVDAQAMIRAANEAANSRIIKPRR